MMYFRSSSCPRIQLGSCMFHGGDVTASTTEVSHHFFMYPICVLYQNITRACHGSSVPNRLAEIRPWFSVQLILENSGRFWPQGCIAFSPPSEASVSKEF